MWKKGGLYDVAVWVRVSIHHNNMDSLSLDLSTYKCAHHIRIMSALTTSTFMYYCCTLGIWVTYRMRMKTSIDHLMKGDMGSDRTGYYYS